MRRAAALALLAWPALAHAAPARLDFEVALDPAGRRLQASGTVTVPAGEAVALVLAPRFEATEVKLGERALPAESQGRWRVPAGERPRTVHVRWRGPLAPLDAAASHRDTLGRLEPASGPDGSFLPASSGWYPAPEGLLASHRVRLSLPAGQRGLVAGRLVEERDDHSGYRAQFEFPHPGEGIDLMAGPYVVDERRVKLADGREARLRTWFHPAIAELSAGYLDAVARHLQAFEARIGPYPFTEFGVVSSPTPTGFGMPTLTYLGVNVLRLPFLKSTSLGHEVLHNWWGNGVYPDWARGNWSEGLTTYMADYAFREAEGPAAAAEMRMAWLRDFAVMPREQDQPLAAFTARTHGASSIVGYGKAAMLFHMVRGEIGDAAFDRALRAFWREQQFRVAGWDTLRAHFERASGRPLAGFFAQWLERTGAPRVQLLSARRGAPGSDRVTVVLSQDEPARALRVPLGIETAAGLERRTVTLRVPRQSFEITAGAGARAVALDPDTDLFRRLAPDEAPPILRELMLDPRTRVVALTPAFTEAAATLGAATLEGPGRPAAAAALGRDEPALVVGDFAQVARFARERGLREAIPAQPAGTTAAVWLDRDAGTTLALVAANDPAAAAALAGPLPHYGKQSWLAFGGARALSRGTWTGRPQRISLE